MKYIPFTSVLNGIGYAHAYKLLQTFESIPQEKNNPLGMKIQVYNLIWKLSDRHIQDDIEIEFQVIQRLSLLPDAFTYAQPLLAEIEGVRGRYFSKRLHHAVVRFVTDNGADRNAIKRILKKVTMSV